MGNYVLWICIGLAGVRALSSGLRAPALIFPKKSLIGPETWPTVLVDLAIAVIESMAIVFPGRRRYGRLTKARMTVRIRWNVVCYVTASRLDTIMKALPRDLSPSRRWRRWVVSNWSGVAATGQACCEDRQQNRLRVRWRIKLENSCAFGTPCNEGGLGMQILSRIFTDQKRLPIRKNTRDGRKPQREPAECPEGDRSTEIWRDR